MGILQFLILALLAIQTLEAALGIALLILRISRKAKRRPSGRRYIKLR